jgi:hypothetical protein
MKYQRPATSAIGQMKSSETNEAGLRRQAAFLDSGSYDGRQLLRSADELAQLRAERDKLKALLTRCLSALDGEALADRNFHKPLSKCGAWLALRKDIEAEINPIQR